MLSGSSESDAALRAFGSELGVTRALMGTNLAHHFP